MTPLERRRRDYPSVDLEPVLRPYLRYGTPPAMLDAYARGEYLGSLGFFTSGAVRSFVHMPVREGLHELLQEHADAARSVLAFLVGLGCHTATSRNNT